MDVLDRIDGNIGGNGVYLRRNEVSDGPGTRRTGADKPYAVADGIVLVADQENVVWGVHGIRHVGITDPLELRLTVISGRKCGPLAIDRRSLGHLRCDHGILGFRSSRNTGQHRALRVACGNAGKVQR
jgi:hypothetical protein